jgi:hypothetical protein
MTGADPFRSKAVGDVGPTGSLERSVRIEHDRRRLAFAVVASCAATLAVAGMLVVSILHPAPTAPPWTLAPLGAALIIAALGFVRNIVRLQDGDPALVISPRGLNFRPYLFGEITHIPWSAVLGLRSRSYKQQRFIVVKVDAIDHYAPRVGFLGFLRRLGKHRSAADEISFSTPMAKSAWHDLDITLQHYLARYGCADAANEADDRYQRRASVESPPAPVDKRNAS